jgi:enoyl-CoA hydratase
MSPAEPQFETLLVDRHGEIALLTLNRPQSLNALSSQVFADLAEAVEWVSEQAELLALLITGQERAFAAGADLTELDAVESAFEGRELSLAGQDVFQVISQLPIPTMAAISGYALGGGLELALACDLRVAHPQAKLGFPEVKLGLIPGYGGTQRLPRLIGLGRALDLLLSGRQVSAGEALQMGLINLVSEEPLQAAREYLERLLSSSAPLSVGLIKEAVRRGQDGPLGEGLELEADLFGLACSSADKREGVRAFLEKRSPRWEGR